MVTYSQIKVCDWILLSAPMRVFPDLNERPYEDVIAQRAVIQVGGLVNNDIFTTNDVTYAGVTKLRHSSSHSGLARICKVLCWLAE